jgi:hypothetical protein
MAVSTVEMYQVDPALRTIPSSSGCCRCERNQSDSSSPKSGFASDRPYYHYLSPRMMSESPIDYYYNSDDDFVDRGNDDYLYCMLE